MTASPLIAIATLTRRTVTPAPASCVLWAGGQREREPHAAQAIALFCYQLRKHIGALTAVLGGLDILVFTGGIGERTGAARWEVCRGLAYLGVDLDPQRNAVHADVISTPGSACMVWVIPTNEDLMIGHTRTLLVSAAAP
jgi:acetate kinase